MPPANLATRLGDLRTKAGLTKSALARPRYTPSFVSQIESGRKRPSSEALEFFAGKLGVSPRYLATGVPDGIEHRLDHVLERAQRLLSEAPEDAESLAGGVIEQAEAHQLAPTVARALVLKGQALMLQNQPRHAIDAYEEALQGQLSDFDQGMASGALARAYRSVGDLSYAAEVVEGFLTRRRGEPLPPAVAADLQTVLVSVFFERGDVLRAERAAQRALIAAQQGAPIEVQARAYWDASRVLAEGGRWEESLDLVSRARGLMERLGDPRRVGRLHTAHAFICLEAEPPRMAEAAEHLERAEVLLGEMSTAADLAYLHTERSRLALMEERYDRALGDAERALLYSGHDALEESRALFLKGKALAGLGRVEESRAVLEDAASRFAKLGARVQEAACWREVGELDVASGDMEGAMASLRSGLSALDPWGGSRV